MVRTESGSRTTRADDALRTALAKLSSHLHETRVALRRIWGLLGDMFRAARKHTIDQFRAVDPWPDAHCPAPRGVSTRSLVFAALASGLFWGVVAGVVYLVWEVWPWK